MTQAGEAGLLSFRHIAKRFGPVQVIDDVSFDVPAGKVVALLGPSGSGKSTLLRVAAGLERPDAGHVWVGGRDITALPPWDRPVGMVFQHYALFPHLDVQANVAYGLLARRFRQAPWWQRARWLAGLERAAWGDTTLATQVKATLEMLEIGALASRKPGQLSGGQQQRVALARVLVTRPQVLLLDEPLSALDAGLRERIRGELRELQRRLGLTMLHVTHDQDEAFALADEVAVMLEGHLCQVGPPEAVYRRPASGEVAEFLRIPNRFTAELDGTPVDVFVHAEDVQLEQASSASEAGWGDPARAPRLGWRRRGRIVAAEFHGAVHRYRVEAADRAWVASVPRALGGPLRVGDAVDMQVEAEAALLYPRAPSRPGGGGGDGTPAAAEAASMRGGALRP